MLARPCYRDFSVDRALRALESEGSYGVVAKEGGSVLGVACCSHLVWDSEQFGFQAARVNWMAACGSYAEARETETLMLK